ncbi:MAG: response regulator [Cyanobacteria bacterium]|nr:response regulator [Cyanobacteriota bacterium]MDA0867461.1 response regulator [Cyanobacteriota bacterium]
MVDSEVKPSGIAIHEFAAHKQIKLFATLRQQQFSGQISLKALNGIEWTFYLSWGRLVYATGGEHAVRRWLRQVSHYCPEIALDSKTLASELSQASEHHLHPCWEYQLLCRWYKQGKITQRQAAQVISAAIVEILFDVTQTSKILYQISPEAALSEQLVLINAEQIIRKSDVFQQAWKAAKLADRSPNLVPVIKSPTELKQRTPSNVYQNLSKLLDGQQTLRDLGNRLNRDVLEITQSLLPYIQAGLIDLIKIADAKSPIAHQPPTATPKPQPKAPLIACVDDSLSICQSMEKILSKAGYRVISTQDALRALALLMARKPDLIFLDLVMPNTNGYELCSHLRRLPIFRDTPIIILTGNDGVIDRIRAKMVGASAFLSKPVEINVVLDLVKKQLSQQAIPSA